MKKMVDIIYTFKPRRLEPKVVASEGDIKKEMKVGGKVCTRRSVHLVYADAYDAAKKWFDSHKSDKIYIQKFHLRVHGSRRWVVYTRRR